MMASERFQSVVFIDMDHTLLEGPFESIVFPQILGEISQKTGLEFETLLRWVRAENLQRQSNPAYSSAQAMDWDDIFSQVAAILGVKLRKNASELVRAHPGAPSTTVYPGAREALESLAASTPRRALVLATKGLWKYQLPILEGVGLLPYFDDVITPDGSQGFKNSFAFYCRWPQITRLQTMVGDTYEEDIVPAHQFGFKTVWVNRKDPNLAPNPDPFSRHADLQGSLPDPCIRPDAIIISLLELPQVIDRLEYDALST